MYWHHYRDNHLQRIRSFFNYIDFVSGWVLEKKKHCWLRNKIKGFCTLTMFLRRKCWQQWHLTGSVVTALATLGDATKNRNDPISVTPPKVAKASIIVTVACRCRQHYRASLCQWKHSLKRSFCWKRNGKNNGLSMGNLGRVLKDFSRP